MKGIEIVDTNAGNILKYGVCGYKNIKRAGYPEKIEWLKDRFPEGMKIKTLVCKAKMIEGRNYGCGYRSKGAQWKY